MGLTGPLATFCQKEWTSWHCCLILWRVRYALPFLVCLGLLIVGCSNPEAQLAGTWKGDIKLTPAQEKEPAAAFAKALLKDISLEMRGDKTCAMTIMGQSADGNWSLSGNTVTITMKPKPGGKSNGMTFENKPANFTLSPDGKSLALVQSGSVDTGLTFTKQGS